VVVPSSRRRPLVALVVVLAVLALVAAGIVVGRLSADGSSTAGTTTTSTSTTETVVDGSIISTTTVDVASAAAGVVAVTATVGQDTGFGQQESVGAGSGFVLDEEGRILTNDHVVEGASAIRVSFADGTKVRATLLATDPLLDLAVIQVDVPAATLHPVALGRAEALRLGEAVVAIGNPFGLERSVSAGVVSGLHRQIRAPNGFTLSNAIQTDAAINHGNSGGPLLDADGRVVGVNAQIADSGVDANVGVGFAVALDAAAREAIETLAQGRTVSHAWLGVALDDVDAILATSGEVESTSGALLTAIVPGGPADDAGLRGGSTVTSIDGAEYCLGGDIVVAVGETEIASPGDLQTAISGVDPGTTVKLDVVREDGSEQTIAVVLGAQPTSAPEATNGCG
jgi:S1-C subfamily serine protease